MEKINIFWFRRDLRLEDNHGLFSALKERIPVLPLFIFDRDILDHLENHDDPRVTFIYDEISNLKHRLESLGSTLLVKYGKPIEIFHEILLAHSVASVYTNHDYEPYARKRDETVHEFLQQQGIPFLTFKDQVIFEKNEILKADKTPYTVFTPYQRKWKESFSKASVQSYPAGNFKDSFYKKVPLGMPSLESMGFRRTETIFPDRVINEKLIADYDRTRDFPFLEGTSRLGLHLRFGTISIRGLVETTSRLNEIYLNELVWREFYMMILWHFPQIVTTSFKPAYERIQWKNDEGFFQAWCAGNTGYPIVDAGMRQLNQTGFMHNRLRMITASFLTKHLLIDWRWGEAYFAKKLLDYELASNNGGWQWAAGTGCDAAPYFRIFNPDLQAQKYDPDKKYILRWVPEFKEGRYKPRIVDHADARNLAITTYKNAILGSV